ncbi:MAG: bifunctional demethylmenaquinone methyltransferase/2-methoxy-6-polyprenyl-1,4-benzoquinol methylase UbiE [Desulfobacteraceae bacterium]|nr:MAG: bifunctional demethylmenaquinone methyltransferase/2-methoxy-6-polyprenyl-1,4-benzoquinol methylase UbiE [Desulfobacteraceae bacterium]
MNRELEFVKDMFDSIAPKYDFLNRLLSLRQDVMWRKEMVKAAHLPDHPLTLDVACGTCDVALEIYRQSRATARVIGVDFSFGMLAKGLEKLGARNRASTIRSKIRLINGDALALPFAKDLFDGVFIAFGIRNIMDRQRAIQSFYNVLKPGRRLAVLELTTPENNVLKALYMLYFKKILPWIGSLFSKNSHAYHYLPDSVIKFPSSVEFAGIMKQAGFDHVMFKPMTLGIVTLFVGTKKR